MSDPETLIKVVWPSHRDEVYEGEIMGIQTLRHETPEVVQDQIASQYGTDFVHINAGKSVSDTLAMVLKVPAKPVLDELRKKIDYYQDRVEDLEDELSTEMGNRKEAQKNAKQKQDAYKLLQHEKAGIQKDLRDLERDYEAQTAQMQRLRDALGMERIEEILGDDS